MTWIYCNVFKLGKQSEQEYGGKSVHANLINSFIGLNKFHGTCGDHLDNW